MKRIMILPLLLIMLVSITAQAGGPGKKDWRWWEVGKISSDLELSEDQKTQLNDIATKFDPILEQASENFKPTQDAFHNAKSNKETSSADVIKAFDTMWDSKYKMERVKLDMFLEMRDVLTQEQLTKLQEIKKDHRDKMMKRGERMMNKPDQMKDKKN